MNEELRELEELAKEFIIGYEELSKEKIELLANIRKMEHERDILLNKVQRYNNILTKMYLEFAEPEREQ